MATVALTIPANAEDTVSPGCEFDCDETVIRLGVGATFAPEYEGSDEYEIGALPIVSVENFHGFNLDFGRLSYDLVELGGQAQGWRLVAGPLIGLADSRDESDSNALRGLGDVDFGVDVGAYANLMYGPVLFDLSLTQEVAGGHEGLLAGFGVGTQIPVTEKFGLAPMVSTTWASDDYMDSFFGVSTGQAANSGLSAFDAEAGFKDITVQLGAFYQLTDNITLDAGIGYSRLLGDAADSPLVTGANGSADQFFTMFGISYQFQY